MSSLPRPSQKEKILKAALECFAEMWYEGTRVRHVAQRAEVSEAALYRHYRSMESLAEELFTEHFLGFAANLVEATSTGDPETRLREGVRVTLATYRANPVGFTFALLRTSTFLPKLPAGTRYPIEIVEGVIVDGQRTGDLRAGQPNVLAAIFLGSVLQTIVLANLSAPGALVLIDDLQHDQVIEDAAVAALKV